MHVRSCLRTRAPLLDLYARPSCTALQHVYNLSEVGPSSGGVRVGFLRWMDGALLWLGGILHMIDYKASHCAGKLCKSLALYSLHDLLDPELL